MCGLLLGHWYTWHAAGGAAVQRVKQELDELLLCVLLLQFPQWYVLAVVLGIGRMALGAADGLIKFFAFTGAADCHGPVAKWWGKGHQIMAQGIDCVCLFLFTKTMQQVRHEGAGLEVLRIIQPMPQPAC